MSVKILLTGWLTILTPLCALNLCLAEEPLVLVKDGEAGAVIVIPNEPEESVAQAAEICRDIVEKMTGAQLEIKTEKEYQDSGSTVILIGQSQLARKLGVEVPQDVNGPDHYLIRTINNRSGKYLALVGNDRWHPNRGSIFAVYDLFWRLGCGWYGPDELWHVIPKRKILTVPAMDDFQSPAFLARSLWLHGDIGMVKDAWRLGGRDINIGHAMQELVPPDKYKEYYGGKGNPSITHPEVIKIIADDLRKRIDESKAPADYRVPMSITPEDGRHIYQHPDAPVVGNDSAKIVYMANAVAKELQKTHPNRFQLGCISAYYLTYSPPEPMIKAEPNIVLMQVNEGNHSKPLEFPILHEYRHKGRSNNRVNESFRGWEQTGALQGIYEWWLPGIEKGAWGRLPWYSMYTASQNLQFWHRRGVRYMKYEAWAEYDEDWFSLRWPTYYIAARCMWDTKPTHEEIMTDACQQLYGPAASEMWKYYNTVEKAMLDCMEPCGNWWLPHPLKVFTPEYEALADEHMQKAVELVEQTGSPEVTARVANQQKFWQQAKGIIANLRAGKEWDYSSEE